MSRMSEPPLEYLRDCSNTSLRYFELSKLEHVANLRREMVVLLDEMMEESALALFARWMLEKRTISGGPSRNGSAAKSVEAKRARGLLGQFFNSGQILAGHDGGANGTAGTARGGVSAREEAADGAGCQGEARPEPEPAAPELAAAERPAARAERRMGRRNGRGARAAGREGAGEPEQL